jgi:hypothetical protein
MVVGDCRATTLHRGADPWQSHQALTSDSTCGPSIASNPRMLTVKH